MLTVEGALEDMTLRIYPTTPDSEERCGWSEKSVCVCVCVCQCVSECESESVWVQVWECECEGVDIYMHVYGGVGYM